LISFIVPGEPTQSNSWNPSLPILSYSAKYDLDFSTFSPINLNFSNSSNGTSTEIYFSYKDLEESDIFFSSPQDSSL
jgi:hypothetical protein